MDWESLVSDLEGPHGDTVTLYKTVRNLLDKAQLPTTDKFAFDVIEALTARCRAQSVPMPHLELAHDMLATAAGFYAGEQLDKIPAFPEQWDHISVGMFRDCLLLQKKRLEQSTQAVAILAAGLVDSFFRLAKMLPAYARYTASDADSQYPSIPLVDAIPNIGKAIEALCIPFAVENQFGFFEGLRQDLRENMERYAARKNTKRIIDPSNVDLPPRELVETFLGGTLFESMLLEVNIPFSIPDEQRFAGHWIIAPSGRGKTTLLHSMFLEDLKKDASIILIDSKGDLIGPIKELAAIKDRLVLIEPDPDFTFALNPFDVSKANILQAVSLIEYVMAGLLEAKFTALQSTLFRNVVPAIIEGLPEPTIETFKQVMSKGLPGNALGKLNPHAAAFFTNKETGFWSKTYESTRKEVVWRLDYLMTNPVLRTMFSAVQTKLDISKEMDAGKVIVINNAKSMLTDEGAEFFGRFFIALIVRAAQQRAGRRPEDKKPCYVYIDECHTVIAKDARVPTILDECRSQKIALILAHQRTAQLSDLVLDAAANSAVRMANSDDEAKYLSDKLRMDVDTLRSLPAGTFGTFVRDVTAKGVALRVPHVSLASLPRMSPEEQVAVRAQMRASYGFVTQPARAFEVAPDMPIPASAGSGQSATSPRIDEALPDRRDGSEAGPTW